MMNLLTIPFRALTRLEIYRTAGAARFVWAFRYLLFLSVISTVIMFLIFVRVLLPAVDETVEWIQSEMPIVTLSSDGLAMDQPSPYTMIHPDAGPLITFDLQRADVNAEQMGPAAVFITSSRIYVKQSPEEIRVYDVVDYFKNYYQNQPEGRASITPETVGRFYRGIRPWLLGIFGVLYLPFFLLWKLVAAIFYSWFGLIINMGRNEKLTYTGILNISIVAMTASILLQWIRLLAPIFNEIPFIEVLGILLTFVYLFIGIRKTDTPVPAE